MKKQKPKNKKRVQKRRPAHRLSWFLAAFLLIEISLFAAWLGTSWHNDHKKSQELLTQIDEPIYPLSLTPSSGAASTLNVTPANTPDYKVPPVKNGLAPIISTIPTKEPVVFLGIDDGANKQDFELQMMEDNHVKASLFLANVFIKNNPEFFKGFINEGSLIEDHTMDHKLLSKLSYNDQKKEICDEADLFTKIYKRRPILFRPPGGDYNTDTQRAAAACGMKAVVMWIAKANGGSMQYQIGHSLRAGDIVLMHFRPEFRKDMQAFLDAEKEAGLHTELLENWLSNRVF